MILINLGTFLMNIIEKNLKKIPFNNTIAINFFKRKHLDKLFNKKYKNVYPPNIKDLYFIFKIITLFKRINVLEFGCGFSSIIIKKALEDNKLKYKNTNFEEMGLKNTFQHFILDDQIKYIKIAKNRNSEYFKKNNIQQKYIFSNCEMTSFNNPVCTQYKKLPNIIPDFIYLDGPDLNKIHGNFNGINISKNKDFTPMSCDILKIENILLPGTIILIDGRGLNSSFLRNNFKRNWIYFYNVFSDQHIFYLNDVSIGNKNSKLIDFYNFIKVD